MLTKENQPTSVSICGVEARRYETSDGYGFLATKFPFVFTIFPSPSIAPDLHLNVNGGAVQWNHTMRVVDDASLVQVYDTAIGMMEGVAENFVRDMLSIPFRHTGPRATKGPPAPKRVTCECGSIVVYPNGMCHDCWIKRFREEE